MKKSELRRALKPLVTELVEESLEEIIYQDGFIQEKIQEMLLKGNLLSNVIVEVAKGLTQKQVITTQPVYVQVPQQTQPVYVQPRQNQSYVNPYIEEARQELEREKMIYANQQNTYAGPHNANPDQFEQFREDSFALRQNEQDNARHRLEARTGMVGIFEGLIPLQEGGAFDDSKVTLSNAAQKAGPLAGTDPSDPGVNIDGLFDMFGNTWNEKISNI
jgi:hypothetical protein